MTKQSHTLPPATPLSQQVGGHAGIQVTEDESLLLKRASPREIAFYQLARDVDDPSTGVHALADWMPRFFGLLKLEGKLADVQGADSAPVLVPLTPEEQGASTAGDGLDNVNGGAADLAPQTLVLQNLLYGYRKPCILDIKLGTVLYDEDTPEEKKARMIKKAAESTSLPTGMRLTGFQVYSNHAPDPIVFGREYGYSLKPEQLQEGIGRFFPCSITSNSATETSPSHSNAGLPADTLLTLLSSLCNSLVQLRQSLNSAHVRIVGGSVLIVYEGDWESAIAASGRGGGPGYEDIERDDADEDEIDQIEVEVDEQGEIVTMEFAPDVMTETSSSSDMEVQSRLYTVALIDFAHTRVVPGQGPDEGVLKGMDTLIRLVECKKQEVMEFIEKEKV